ncbi:hypothetical protein DFH29DRAFT_920859 [Suillus ampliporus]|nr:hypothetical protein DFH29DRAFT_920859 [Suillus ampliporus]
MWLLSTISLWRAVSTAASPLGNINLSPTMALRHLSIPGILSSISYRSLRRLEASPANTDTSFSPRILAFE